MFAAEIKVAKRLARAAGAAVLRHYASKVAVEYKDSGHTDPVTQADRDANLIIVEGLTAAFPDDAVLAEESPPSATRHQRQRLWCVDPLDGTREFIAHNGQFAVMIGLAVDAVARLGVVYQPTTDTLYWGADGAAYREHDGVINVLSTTGNNDTSQAVLMVSRSHLSSEVEAAARLLHVRRTEPLGSVGLKVVQIAMGLADLYLSFSTKTFEWDACAPEAILRAAGGQMTDVKGGPLRYNQSTPNTPRGILASNGILHAPCVECLQASALTRRF